MIVFKYGERNAKQNGVGNFGINYNDSHSVCCDQTHQTEALRQETAENAEHKLQAYIGR